MTQASAPASTAIPEIVFIVPYRNRPQQKFFFERWMRYVLEDYAPATYKIFFSEQFPKKDFNRGAVKNAGFLAVKAMYPNDYRNITFVFNDVDSLPYKKNLLNYKTKPGVVKHFFGFEDALGGIFSITGGDFEKIKGFPNYWLWGYEDNILNNRVVATPGLTIDRTVFYPVFNQNILHLTDTIHRTLNVHSVAIKGSTDLQNNILSIKNLRYSVVANVIKLEHFEITAKEEIEKLNFKITDDIKKHKKEIATKRIRAAQEKSAAVQERRHKQRFAMKL